MPLTSLDSRHSQNSESRELKIQAGLQLLRLWEVADPALGHSVEAGSEAEEFQAADELRDEGGSRPKHAFPHQGSSKGHWSPGESRTAGDVWAVWKRADRTLWRSPCGGALPVSLGLSLPFCTAMFCIIFNSFLQLCP